MIKKFVLANIRGVTDIKIYILILLANLHFINIKLICINILWN